MKDFCIKVTYPLLLISILFSCCSAVIKKQSQKIKNMENIQFIPKEFNDIKLGYYETEENCCSPAWISEMRTINSIIINTPQKIICDMNKEDFVPVIPVCATYSVSLRRGFKYHNLSAKMLYIRKIDDGAIYFGEIVNKDIQYFEYPEPDPYDEEKEKKRLAMVEEAQKYSDMELDQGQLGGGYLNINLMEYVDMPFLPGKYEVWLSFCGLESNHTIVEIIAE